MFREALYGLTPFAIAISLALGVVSCGPVEVVAPIPSMSDDMEEACESGVAPACQDLALISEGDRRTELFRKACEGGDASACESLAEIFDSEEEAEARWAVVELQCQHRDSQGCVELGMRHVGESLQETSSDERAKAMEYFEDACLMDSAVGCELVGALHQFNGDFDEAVKYYMLALKHGSIRRHFWGLSQPEYPGLVDEDARETLSDATLRVLCNIGDPGACYVVSSDELEEEERREHRVRYACLAGHMSACQMWFDLFQRAAGEVSVELAQRSCQEAGMVCIYGARVLARATEARSEVVPMMLISCLLIDYCDPAFAFALDGQPSNSELQMIREVLETRCSRGTRATFCTDLAELGVEPGPRVLHLTNHPNNTTARCSGSTSCYMIGWQAKTGSDGVQRTRAGARVAYGRGCEMGDVSACNALATLERWGLGGPRDLSRAVELLEQACEGSVHEACLSLSDLHLVGHGVQQNRERAVELLKAACDSDLPLACDELQKLHGVSYDPPIALPSTNGPGFFRSWCDAGEPEACYYLARMLDIGADIEVDREAAAKRYQQACDDNIGEACFTLAERYRSGDGVSRDAERANELVEQACELGAPGACPGEEIPANGLQE